MSQNVGSSANNQKISRREDVCGVGWGSAVATRGAAGFVLRGSRGKGAAGSDGERPVLLRIRRRGRRGRQGRHANPEDRGGKVIRFKSLTPPLLIGDCRFGGFGEAQLFCPNNHKKIRDITPGVLHLFETPVFFCGGL